MIYLLDTDICIYTITQKYKKLIRRLKSIGKSHEIGISSITYAELQFGIQNSSRVIENQLALVEFLAPLKTFDFDERAGIEFGSVRLNLQEKGKLIGPYDMLIAAHARSLNATLITNNESEFKRVAGLHVENWVKL
ncbi:MAG: Ribonuclease VapC2 [Turneriella sp.]|nr:Ribonuclease VapC2 [Turneriella sp.]